MSTLRIKIPTILNYQEYMGDSLVANNPIQLYGKATIVLLKKIKKEKRINTKSNFKQDYCLRNANLSGVYGRCHFDTPYTFNINIKIQLNEQKTQVSVDSQVTSEFCSI